jgi:membrane protein YqaA with SNARE-associated domain
MCAVAVALWRGLIPIEWLASFGYQGIFLLSLVNGIAPVGGPSQIATFLVAGKLNPLWVGLAAGVGGAIGELAGYAFGYTFRAAQSNEVERKIQRIANWQFLRISQERSFIPLFVLASVPNPFFDPVSAIAGSLRISLARYFIPVLLGKTVRHLVIALAGYYTISGKVTSILREAPMTDYLNSGVFVGILFCIALVAWLVRTVFEDEPDPLVLNFTFFAFAGQCILTAEVARELTKESVLVLVLLAPAILILLLQIFTIRAQLNKTLEHYAKVLDEYKIGDRSPVEIERWAAVLARITGVDFFPEFYQHYIKVGSAREKRRRQAVEVLPRDAFRIGGDTGIKPDKLIVPPDERRVLWRFYVALCILSWIVFIICILAARRHQ